MAQIAADLGRNIQHAADLKSNLMNFLLTFRDETIQPPLDSIKSAASIEGLQQVSQEHSLPVPKPSKSTVVQHAYD